MSIPRHMIDRAQRHLRAADPVLRTVIDRVGPCELKLQRNRFASLARAIVAQQISSAAARTIWGRLEQLVRPGRVTPQAIAGRSFADLQSIGLSRQKTTYLLDLANKAREKQIRLTRIGLLSDEEIVENLTVVKGIGRWTAQMFLIFSLGRLDVFAPDDLGLRSAIRNLYALPDLPNRAHSLTIAQPWRPYSSIASWYLWRSLE